MAGSARKLAATRSSRLASASRMRAATMGGITPVTSNPSAPANRDRRDRIVAPTVLAVIEEAIARDPGGGAPSAEARKVMSNSSGTNSDFPRPVRGTDVVWIESVRSVTVFVRAGAASVIPVAAVFGTGGAKKPLTTVIVPLIVAFGVAVAVNVRGEP